MKTVEYKNQIESGKTETQLNAECAAYVKGQGFPVYRTHAGKVKVRGGWMQLNPENTTDYIFDVYGSIVYFEGKKTGEKVSKEQRRKHEQLLNNGSLVICTDSLDLFIFQFNIAVKLCKGRAFRNKEV